MKKQLLILLSALFVTSCANQTQTISIIAPEGTPSLALANFYANEKESYSEFSIKGGSDPLVAAFSSSEYDVIVAPTNLGAKFYNSTKNYILYQTIVWGNLYLASKQEINSFADVENKTITYFGGNSATPYIVLKSLIDSYKLENVTLTNVDDVATANSMLMSNKADIIVSAQPSLTKIINTSASKNITIHTLDLQSEWQKLTGASSYPQASIFFKKELKGKIDKTLQKLTDSVKDTIKDPATSAKNAVSMYEAFKNLGEDVLTSAIPNAHYGIDENQKSAIEFYFNKMNELGLSKLYGEQLPDEEFYYNI